KGIRLDAFDPAAHGGTGHRFNWNHVADARAAGALSGLEPIILAGGLSPDCVSHAIDLVMPWAVDVASGVEKAPGVKDLRKVEDFIRATREGNELRSEFWVK
ncbi:MAG: phosphoribosylanthranilate isomerase, partial [Phycisphaerae bacterium]